MFSQIFRLHSLCRPHSPNHIDRHLQRLFRRLDPYLCPAEISELKKVMNDVFAFAGTGDVDEAYGFEGRAAELFTAPGPQPDWPRNSCRFHFLPFT